MSKLTLVFNKDGTVDTNLAEDISPNVLLLGLTTVLLGFIEEASRDDEIHDRAIDIDIVTAKLNRKKKGNTND